MSIRNLHRHRCHFWGEMMINIPSEIVQRVRKFSLSFSLNRSDYINYKGRNSLCINMKLHFAWSIGELNWDDGGLCGEL